MTETIRGAVRGILEINQQDYRGLHTSGMHWHTDLTANDRRGTAIVTGKNLLGYYCRTNKHQQQKQFADHPGP